MHRLRANPSRVKAWGVAACGPGGRVLHAVDEIGFAVCRRPRAVQIVAVFDHVERVCGKCFARPGVRRSLFDLASRLAVDAPGATKQSETQLSAAGAGAELELGGLDHDSSVKQGPLAKWLAIAAPRALETIGNNRRGRHRAYEDMYAGAHAQTRVIRCEICEAAHEWRPLEQVAASGWVYRLEGIPARIRWRCREHKDRPWVKGRSVDGETPEVRR